MTGKEILTTPPTYDKQGVWENFKDWIGFGSAAKERQYNAEQAQIQRNWQEYMSNTSYQRAVKDMEAAGLNPALAFQNGGASTPSGYSASTGGTAGNSLANNINSATNLIKSIAGTNGKKQDNPASIVNTAIGILKLLK